MVKRFTSDAEVGRTARLRFGLPILFLFAINGLKVVNSYVGRDFMTAIAARERTGFIAQALNHLGVFAALTAIGVISRYTRKSLDLLWEVSDVPATVDGALVPDGSPLFHRHRLCQIPRLIHVGAPD